jgi:MFS family permease
VYLSQAGQGPARAGLVRVPGTVVALGAVSLLTDISSEMVAAFLPLYLVYTLQVSYVQFGLLDGLYTGATAVLRLAGGLLSDRWRRPKAVAGAGYAMSAVTRAGMLAVGASGFGIGLMIAIDRAGKGLRTAPRDALITAAVAPDRLGGAFGVHRTMDTTGALLGPLLTFLLLMSIGTAAEPIFVVSTAFALLGLIVLIGFVPSGPGRAARTVVPSAAPRPMWSDGLALLSDRAVRRAALVAAVLGLATLSDAFLFLLVQRSAGVSPALLPLLPLGTAAVFLMAATPMGRIADRVGRRRTFLVGHVLLLAAYALIAAQLAGAAVVVAVLVLHGLFYAATDGVLSAWVAALVPEPVRASGLAVVQTAQALARFASSVTVGVLLTVATFTTAVGISTVALTVALALAVLIAGGVRRHHPLGPHRPKRM